MTFKVEKGQGRHQVSLDVTLTMDGISVLLLGGEKPHVGGMVLVQPRASLTGEGVSSDAWVIPLPGHKDVFVGEKVGRLICHQIQEIVAVTAGIHIDQASSKDLEIILDNCLLGAQEVVEKCLPLREKKG